MIAKRTSIIRLMVSLAVLAALFIYTLLEGDNFSDVFGWFVFGWLFMFCLWTAFVWLRERIGRHCYWVIPAFCALYYGAGVLTVNAIPGWSGLGVAIAFIFTLAVLAASVVFFLIEMLIYLFYRKK